MNTVHRSASFTGRSAERAISWNSPTMLMPCLLASSWRKLPVPAAQTLFMSKSRGWVLTMEMYFESCPPISKIVSISGSISTAPLAWAVISSMIRSAFRKSPTTFLPEPVVATPRISIRFPRASRITSRRCWVTSIGFPWVCT